MSNEISVRVNTDGINDSASETVTSMNELSSASEDATLSLQDASNAAQELSDSLSNVDGSGLSDAASAADELSSSAGNASEEIDNMSNSSQAFYSGMNNWVTAITTSSNPVVMDYQNNAYNCCPTSLSIEYKLLLWECE